MMIQRTSMLFIAGCLVTVSGCGTVLHELQPHRLWRWNYQEPTGRTDGALFSVPDTPDVPVVPSPVPQQADGPSTAHE